MAPKKPTAAPPSPAPAAASKQLDPKEAGKIVARLVIITIILTAFSSSLIFMGFTYVVVLVLVSVLPAVVAHIVDKRKGRAASRCVLFFNLAGLLPPLFDVMLSPDPDRTASVLLSDPYIWLIIYGFAGFGWLIVHVVPQAVFLFLVIRSDHTIRSLEAKRLALVDEWGDKVRGNSR